ncbi:putative antibiotic-resistance protein [Neobacillus bataviensis LMG 21833]|uniref:Putative antibiotic-resistance protein n=1 Tax=Neobacillus bataviensis LMG 21833 TaxID=1117379 RepID=K6DPK6_9BACI|nr:amidohydrolase family protein [Neobacillus bataviensis]EKN62726.1 putative antibiotic-resistance protein [Neobacillus bataviensis LMG 21833]
MFIDCSNTLPQFQFEDSQELNPNNTEYRLLFGPRWAQLAGWTKEEFFQQVELHSIEYVMQQVYAKLDEEFAMDNFLNMLRKANIAYHAIHNMDYGRDSSTPPVDHEVVAEILKQYPNRFIGFAGFNPHKGTESLKTVRKAITEQGFKAVVIPPYEHGVKADDRKYYPLYALCDELGIPIWIHSSINYFRETSVFLDHPSNLEAPLMDFKNLKIIAGHGGWPWIPDMIAMLLKYENLYVDTSAFRPRYIAEPNTGWDMFMYYANTLIQDKIVFGSDWLTLGMPINEVIEEVEAWPLKASVKEKFFWKNANKLFKLGLEKPAVTTIIRGES